MGRRNPVAYFGKEGIFYMFNNNLILAPLCGISSGDFQQHTGLH